MTNEVARMARMVRLEAVTGEIDLDFLRSTPSYFIYTLKLVDIKSVGVKVVEVTKLGVPCGTVLFIPGIDPTDILGKAEV